MEKLQCPVCSDTNTEYDKEENALYCINCGYQYEMDCDFDNDEEDDFEGDIDNDYGEIEVMKL